MESNYCYDYNFQSTKNLPYCQIRGKTYQTRNNGFFLMRFFQESQSQSRFYRVQRVESFVNKNAARPWKS